jgi:predicted regulator of Ras-like GTPase activity (Roadblock/LC7/MglB family)
MTPVTGPDLSSVKTSGTSVTLKWKDRNVNESAYRVQRAVGAGISAGSPVIGTVNSTDVTGKGTDYTSTDTIAVGTTQCYQINTVTSGASDSSNEVCAGSMSTLPAPVSDTAVITSLNPAVVSGASSSVTIGTDGLPLISYVEGTTKKAFKVAHCTDSNCTTATITTIDSAGSVGDYSSIKIGKDGLGIVSYTRPLDTTGTRFSTLMVAHCVNVSCTSVNRVVLDGSGANFANSKTSLAIASDGFASIAYRSADGKIRVAHCVNVVCSGVKYTIVDNSGGISNTANEVSIAANQSGKQYLAYYSPSGSLRVATCLVADCTSTARHNVDVSAAGVTNGGYASMTIGRDGLPLISYQKNFTSRSDLIVAQCRNFDCSSVMKTTVDTGGNTGWYTSIAIGGDGLGVVSYYDQTNTNLKVAHCADPVCGTATTTTIDEFDNTGLASSITIGTDGLPLISYSGATEGNLKVAHCANVGCTGGFVVPF